MERGESKDYDFDVKNEWRRMIWNKVLRRTRGREKSECILYLPGSEDLDRAIAIRRGVPQDNLIAVDWERSNVNDVRRSGGAAIHGDVFDMLKAWPVRHRACALVLDFCQGFQRLEDLARLMAIQMSNGALSDAIMAINMQRGRDAESETFRAQLGSLIEKHRTLPDDCGMLPGDLLVSRYRQLISTIDAKHRGFLFAAWYTMNMVKGLENAAKIDDITRRLFDLFEWNSGLVWMSLLLDDVKPRFHTYRSTGGMYFDSVVMNPASSFLDGRSDHSAFIGKAPKRVAMSTAATFAVRTRRQKALMCK